MSRKTFDVLVVGGGIVGLALAHAHARRGQRVGVFEREGRSLKASIRNFGMIWPIGQPEGPLLDMALRSREIWATLADQASFWLDGCGSIHAAYRKEELAVLEEFIANQPWRGEILSPDALCSLSPALRQEGLSGGMYSRTEALVDPREAMVRIPEYLKEAWDVTFHYHTAVTDAGSGWLMTGAGRFEAERIYLCSGADLHSLFPKVYSNLPLTTCKLQMLRTVVQPEGWRMGPPLCGGLTLLHYKAFQDCPSLPALRRLMEDSYPKFSEWGVHVMAAQNGEGGVVIGDTHHYGLDHPPFDDWSMNREILKYLQGMAALKEMEIAESWHGIYAKTSDGSPYIHLVLQPGLHVVNGLGGAGMTLSFGLSELLAVHD